VKERRPVTPRADKSARRAITMGLPGDRGQTLSRNAQYLNSV
jgi:hypothetical protein